MDLDTLQLHPVFIQTYQDKQVMPQVPEDLASDSGSGDTVTSDSGRGGSDEDISHNNMTNNNIGE